MNEQSQVSVQEQPAETEQTLGQEQQQEKAVAKTKGKKVKTKAKSKVGRMPTKTTINLARKERTTSSQSSGPLIVLVILLVVVFAKFAVYDRLMEVAAENEKLVSMQTELDQMKTQNADYDEVAERYGKYSTDWMTDDEKATVDRIVTLTAIEQELLSQARVQQFSVTQNILSVQISGIPLEKVATLANNLEKREEVSGVQVFTAQTKDANKENTNISMVIGLQSEESIRVAEAKAAADKALAEQAAAEGGEGE